MRLSIPFLLLAVACNDGGSSDSDDRDDSDSLDTEDDDTDGETDDTDGETDDTDGPYEDGARLRSGSRLQAVVLRDARDEPGLMWFEDTDLGLACSPRLAGDGVIRCLPERVQSNAYSDQTRYVDSDCTVVGVAVPKDCATSTYVEESSVAPWITAGPAVTTAYHVTSPTHDTTACVVDSLSPRETFHQRGAVVPWTTFVGFSGTVSEVGDGVGVEVMVGEDGSAFPHRFWHLDADQPATLHWGSGAYDVVPARDTFWQNGTTFAKADCDEDAAGYLGTAYDPMPPYAIHCLSGGTCLVHPILETFDTYCEMGTTIDVPAGHKLVRIGDPAPAGTFPALTMAYDNGSGVRFRYASTASVPRAVTVPVGARPDVRVGGVDVTLYRLDGTLVGSAEPRREPTAYESDCTTPLIPTWDGTQAGDLYVQPAQWFCGGWTTGPETIVAAWEVASGLAASQTTYYDQGQSCQVDGTSEVYTATAAVDPWLALASEPLPMP